MTTTTATTTATKAPAAWRLRLFGLVALVMVVAVALGATLLIRSGGPTAIHPGATLTHAVDQPLHCRFGRPC